MRAAAAAVGLAAALGACVPATRLDVPPDPRIRLLVNEPVGDFLADARIASLLAEGCPDVAMTQELFNALVITRETGRAAGTRFDPRSAGRDAAAASAQRYHDLRTRYGRDPFRGSTCAIVAAETEAGSPATAFLSPVIGS